MDLPGNVVRDKLCAVTTLAAPPAEPSLYRLSVEEYDRMVEVGILTPEMRIELLDGLLVHKMPNYPPHASTVHKLTRLLQSRETERWLTRCQLPVRLTHQRSEPEPDVALVRFRTDFYGSHHPEPEEIRLLIEVSDSSVEHDQGDKLRLYAHAGISEYWIVNVPGQAVEVYRRPDPAAGCYGFTRRALRGELLAPAAFPDAVLAVNDILPSPQP